MDFLLNELSVHGQFGTASVFHGAVTSIMAMRKRLQEHGHRLRHFHGDGRVEYHIGQRTVHHGLTVREAIRSIPDMAKRQAFMVWLANGAEAWDTDRFHDPSDYLEADGSVVTDTSIGEAAATGRPLVSFTPSSYTHDPIDVFREGLPPPLKVRNFIHASALESFLQSCAPEVRSWSMLDQWARINCPRLSFSKDLVEPLVASGLPFVPSACERIQQLLQMLDRFKQCHEKTGRTEEGHRLYQDWFSGQKPPFTDSSTGEINDFRDKLTFPHPDRPGEMLFCPFHGKVTTPQLRIHFSWPVAGDTPLYVVYVGPKLTKY